jgi:Tol biopolymer transport system component
MMMRHEPCAALPGPIGSHPATTEDEQGKKRFDMCLRLQRAGLLALTLFLMVPALCACRPEGRTPASTPSVGSGQIAFVSTRDGNHEIHVTNADGSGQTNLTNHPAMDWFPTGSPDGKKIAFATDRDGDRAIYVMNADGSDPVPLTGPGNSFPAWSPDGTHIVLVSDWDGHYEIYVMQADGSNQVRLTHGTVDNLNPAWLP